MGQGKSNGDHGGGSVFVLLTILVLIVGIVAAAGMIMALLNYNRQNDKPININVDGAGPSGYGDSGNGNNGQQGGYGAGDDQMPGGYGSNGAGGWTSESRSGCLHHDDHIWSIRVRAYGNTLAYFDPRNRQIRGYLVDLINAVCQVAGKNCAMVYDNSANCWGNDYPQIGLMGKWYDACSAYSITYNRIRAYKFSHPFAQAGRPVFLTPRGNPRGFDVDNLNDARIGFLTGWWAHPFCILGLLNSNNRRMMGFSLVHTQPCTVSRIGPMMMSANNRSVEYADVDLEDEQIFNYDDIEDIVEALEDGEVDAIYISNELSPATDGSLEVIRELEPCLLGGDSLMLRKDSLMDEWWDPAFERVVQSRTYREICADIDDPAVHGNQEGKSAAELCVDL